MGLTNRQLKFIEFYCQNQNGAEAARQAGYSEASANRSAYRLLNDPAVKSIIDERLEKQLDKLEITGERILAELAKIAFADISDIVDLTNNSITVEDFKKLSQEQRACIASAKKDKHGNIILTFHDKIAALTKLGQHKKLFTDVQETKHSFSKMGQVEIIGSDGKPQPLVFDIGQDPDIVPTEH